LLRVVHIEDDDARRFARIAATGLAKDAVVRVAAGAEGSFAFDYEGEHFALPAADLAAIDLRPLTPAEAAEVPTDAFRMSRLAEGQTAVVAGLSPSCRGALRRRLMDLGFVRGSHVSVGMRSPLGNPVAYVVRGTAIALRREQARQIIVTPL
jgi:iron dependent repressor